MDDSAQEFNKRELKKQKKEEEKKKAERSKMGKNLLTIVAIVAVIGAIGYGLFKLSDPQTSFSPPLAVQVESIDHIKGNEEAAVTVVEYGDYMCPGCASYAPIVSQAANNFGEDIKIVYRHFPLPGHTHAFPAALVAEAAALQGKFWEMNDLLFARQVEWAQLSDPSAKFEEYATMLELDMEKFRADLDSDEVRNKVERDRQSGNDSAVNSTPTFYINGEKVERLPQSAQEFFNLIQEEIDSVNQN